MLKKFCLALSFCFLGGILSPLWATDYVPGEIIVKLKPEAATEAHLRTRLEKAAVKLKSQALGKTTKTSIKKLFTEKRKLLKKQLLAQGPSSNSLADIYKISMPQDENVLDIIKELQKDPQVVYAEPDYLVQAAVTPNDPLYGQQWAYSKTNGPVAWESSTGTSSEIVAVIDTGANYNHEDLSGKVILGHNYIAGNDDPWDDNGHGTHVAGIAAAITNNSTGVAGTNWHARVLAIKTLNSGGSGPVSYVAAGIQEAADAGADVINLSLGQATASSVLEDACTYAYNAGAVLAAAAGNSGVETPFYPAAYTTVMAVAATDQDDKRSVWTGSESSNYGTWVDVSAPGSTIYSTTYTGTNTYGTKNGTSMATPFVAGLAALIKAKHPSWTPTQIMAAITSTTDNIDALNPGYERKLGSGRINMAHALGGYLAYISSPATDNTLSGTVPIRGYATGEGFTSYKLEYRLASATLDAWTQIGSTHTSAVADGLLETWTTVPNSNNTYSLKLTVNTSVELTHTITVNLRNSPSIIGASLGGPNPFNPQTGGNYTIHYDLSTDATVSIYIFDLSGNLLWKRVEAQAAGQNNVLWNGRNAAGEILANGVYLYRLVYDGGGTQSLLGKGKIIILN